MSKSLIMMFIAASVILSACGGDDTASETSEPKQVAILVDIPPDTPLELLRPIIEDPMAEFMAEYGYIRGENIEFRTILSGEATDLTEPLQGIDAIYAAGFEPLGKVINTGLNIPTVFFFDERQFQTDTALRERIQHPDSLITGVLTPQVHEKRFSLLMEIDPSIERVFVPYNPESLNAIEMYETVEAVAQRYDVTVVPYEYTDPQSAQRSFREIPDDIDALFAGSDSMIALAIEGSGSTLLEQGVLLADGLPVGLPTTPLSYGANVNDGQRIVARFIAQILDGTQPTDLPIESVDPQLIISLGAANALGIDVPLDVLRQADVILREEVEITTTVVEAGFCNTTLESPLGTAQACITVACDALEDSAQASYLNREEVANCPAEGSLGVCAAEDRDVVFYDGDAALLQTGCQLGGGTWVAAQE